MCLPQFDLSFELSAMKSTYTTQTTGRIAAAFGVWTNVAGVPTPVHWY